MALPMIFKLPGQFTAFNAANDLKTQEEIERSRIAERKQTADRLNEAGVMPTFGVLKITGYTTILAMTPRRNDGVSRRRNRSGCRQCRSLHRSDSTPSMVVEALLPKRL
jgi:hypothetical protein